jgi:hypothetical protein
VNKTYPEINGAKNITTIQICMAESGAVASLEYYACIDPVPSSSPTATPKSPTVSPSASRITILPTHTPVYYEPTVSPTVETITGVPTPTPSTCDFIRCDFARLAVASFLSNPAQKAQILRDCGIASVTAEDPEGVPRNVNVFDSADIKGTGAKYDPDLGAPNQACGLVNGQRGKGIGAGGMPTAPFPNCLPQDKLLIIQNTDYNETVPNDSPFGGCIILDFARKMNLFDMGLLDVEEPIQILVVCLLLVLFLSLSFSKLYFRFLRLHFICCPIV